MKLKPFASRDCYQSPAIVEVDVISEGILCESIEAEGSTGEKYDRVDDLDGWGF